MCEKIGTVTADGAYDIRRCHTAIIERQATGIIPIRKNGRPWKDGCAATTARNEILRATRHYGRAFWKRWTGYQVPQGKRGHHASGVSCATTPPGPFQRSFSAT